MLLMRNFNLQDIIIGEELIPLEVKYHYVAPGLASPRLLGYRGTTALLRYYRRGLPRFNKKKVPYRGNAVNEMPPAVPVFWGTICHLAVKF